MCAQLEDPDISETDRLSKWQKHGNGVQGQHHEFIEELYLEKDLKEKKGTWLLKEIGIPDIRKDM